MNLSEMLRQACKKMKFPMAELARRTNQTPQNLSIKLKRDTVSFQDFLRYMDILGIHVDMKLVYPDGRAPETPIQDVRAQERIALLEANLELERRNAEYQKALNADIRTALHNVQGNIDMALRDTSDAKHMAECLQKAKSSENRLTMLFESSIYQQKEPQHTMHTEPADPEIIKGKRVLVVEDNDMNRDITKTLLESAGMHADTTNDGEQALKMIMESEPGYYDCVLMDIVMPYMNGIEATKQIRQLPNRIRAGIPVVAMTANASEEYRQAAIDAGMDEYIAKPFDAEKLKATIAKLL